MHLYLVSSALIETTVGKISENLTSVVLAASVITLALGYISKVLIKQSCDKDLVSQSSLCDSLSLSHVSSLISKGSVFLQNFCFV